MKSFIGCVRSCCFFVRCLPFFSRYKKIESILLLTGYFTIPAAAICHFHFVVVLKKTLAYILKNFPANEWKWFNEKIKCKSSRLTPTVWTEGREKKKHRMAIKCNEWNWTHNEKKTKQYNEIPFRVYNRKFIGFLRVIIFINEMLRSTGVRFRSAAIVPMAKSASVTAKVVV